MNSTRIFAVMGKKNVYRTVEACLRFFLRRKIVEPKKIIIIIIPFFSSFCSSFSLTSRREKSCIYMYIDIVRIVSVANRCRGPPFHETHRCGGVRLSAVVQSHRNVCVSLGSVSVGRRWWWWVDCCLTHCRMVERKQ